MTESKGKGRSNNKNAIVEKVEPVGVKFNAFAKSNGRKMWKNASRLNKATIMALTYNTFRNIRILVRSFRCDTVTKYNSIYTTHEIAEPFTLGKLPYKAIGCET